MFQLHDKFWVVHTETERDRERRKRNGVSEQDGKETERKATWKKVKRNVKNC